MRNGRDGAVRLAPITSISYGPCSFSCSLSTSLWLMGSPSALSPARSVEGPIPMKRAFHCAKVQVFGFPEIAEGQIGSVKLDAV